MGNYATVAPSFLRNTPARNYYNPATHCRVTAKYVGDVFCEATTTTATTV